jgi:hypothetical protein
VHAPLLTRPADSDAQTGHGGARAPFQKVAGSLQGALNAGVPAQRLQAYSACLNAPAPGSPRTRGSAPRAAVQLLAKDEPEPAPLVAPRRSEPVIQGFWTELAIGLVSLGVGYKLWQAYQRHQAAMAHQRETRRLETERGDMVHRIQQETSGIEREQDIHVGHDIRSRSESKRKEGGVGYDVNVRPLGEHDGEKVGPFSEPENKLGHEDPSLTTHWGEAARIHELSHVAVFEGYKGRNKGIVGASPDNITAPRSKGKHASEAEQEEVRELYQVAGHLEEIRQSDSELAKLPEKQQEFVRLRLAYMFSAPWNEVDPVTNELTYYLHMSGVSARSPLSRALVRLAKERYALRNAPNHD